MTRLAAALSILAAVFLTGCAEYNRHPTRSEADCLTGVTRLTGGFDRAGQARVSTDLRWIVFRAVPPGEAHHQLYVARLVWKPSPTGPSVAGVDKPVRITPVGSRNGPGAFSPDGFSLLFSSTGTSDDPARMRFFRVDGWEQNVAMADTTRGVDLTEHPLGDRRGTDCNYSPDGRWICFTATGDGPPKIAVMRADGSHVVIVSKGPDGTPVFTPDGKRILYRRDRAGSASDIVSADVSFDADGDITGLKNEQQLTRDDNANLSPAVHPDGRHLVYATSLHGRTNYDLYLMGRDGRDKTRITFWPGADLFPVFSADGKYLIWTSKRTADGSTQVYLARFAFPPGT